MNDMSVLGVMKSIVPITRFNKGEASRIFEEVQSGGTKVVMKNNRPVCVLMSPEKYEHLMEMFSDYIIQEEAQRRLADPGAEKTLSQDEVMESLGVTQADLDAVNDDDAVYRADMSKLTGLELDEELDKGYQDVLAGRTKPAGKVFEDIRMKAPLAGDEK